MMLNPFRDLNLCLHVLLFSSPGSHGVRQAGPGSSRGPVRHHGAAEAGRDPRADQARDPKRAEDQGGGREPAARHYGQEEAGLRGHYAEEEQQEGGGAAPGPAGAQRSHRGQGSRRAPVR